MRRRVALAACLLAAVAGACGKKGPPVAPEARIPAPPSEARASIDENAIVVGWTIPRTRADGSALRDLSALKLYRREEAEGTLPRPAMLSAGRVAGFEQVASVSPSAPAPAIVQGNRIEWVDRGALMPGRRYVYVLTATDSTGRTSAPSERLTVPYLAAPRAPRGLRASPGDRHITLSWQAPAELVDGSPASGPFAYVVLRGTAPDGPFEMVAPGVSDTSYVDKGLENDSEYRYVVRAVRADPRVAASGPPSSPVTATPADTTPPRAPANLVVIPSPGALRLAWAASPDDDVALYAVYRGGGSGGLIRIGTALAGTTTYIDRDVRAGASYRYAVTAIDRARTPNESARSNEATATAQ
jgi:fibronectin type 3 domain-containing protein/predicted small lipoprotein YifL